MRNRPQSRIRFIKFLKDKGAYEAYLSALKTTHYGDIDYFFLSYVGSVDSWVSNVFVYNDTQQGSDYWTDIALQWIAKCNEPQGLKVYKI